MRALDPEVANVIWVGIEALLPTRNDAHPLGCHRQRKSVFTTQPKLEDSKSF